MCVCEGNKPVIVSPILAPTLYTHTHTHARCQGCCWARAETRSEWDNRCARDPSVCVCFPAPLLPMTEGCSVRVARSALDVLVETTQLPAHLKFLLHTQRGSVSDAAPVNNRILCDVFGRHFETLHVDFILQQFYELKPCFVWSHLSVLRVYLRS